MTYRYGGIDVLQGSLARQNFDYFSWLVCDELYDIRKDMWSSLIAQGKIPPTLFLFAEKEENKKRNLAKAYNKAAIHAIINNYDLLVSLQDYIYLPEGALAKFAEVHKRAPEYLITGVTHISRDPFSTKIFDKKGHYTIFAEPFYEQPKRIGWEDVRVKDIYKGKEGTGPIRPEHWEANWAAVPVSVLRMGLRWDEEFDEGIAYENMDFATRAEKIFNYSSALDTTNIAISLPHKDYFEGEREEIKEFSNKEKFEKKWGYK